MSDIDQAALLEIIAGKTRSNTAAAILSNTTDLENAYVDALNAEGSALAENEKYLDSIQGRINLFNNAVQTMWSNALNDDVIKFFVNLGTQLVKLIDNFGLLKTLFIGFGTYAIKKNFNGDLLGGLLTNTESNIEQVRKKLADLESIRDKANVKLQNNPTSRRALEKYNAADTAYNNYKNGLGSKVKEYDDLSSKIDGLKVEREKILDGIDTSLDKSSDAFRQAVRADIEQWVEVDTSKIDAQIKEVEGSLITAQERLRGIYSHPREAREYFKTRLGSINPSKDRDIYAANLEQEINALKGNLQTLKQQRDELIGKSLESKTNDVINQVNDIDAQIEMLSGELLNMQNIGATGFQRLKTSAAAFGKQMLTVGKEIATSFLTMYAISTVIELVTKVFTTIKEKIQDSSNSVESLNDKFEESKNELSEISSNIRELESELESTQERIDELLSTGKLSFTEQEELERLRKQNDELERQIKLKETLQESKQIATNETAITAGDAYLANTSFGSDKSKTERQEKASETGKLVGQALGLIVGGALAFFTGGTSLLIGAGIGALAGGLGGEIIGSAAAGSAYDSEQSVGEAIKNMQATRAGLIEKQQKALANQDTEAYNDATEALSKYDEQMSKHMSQMAEYYNSIDWDTATEEQKKVAQNYADILDTYNINMGASNAKTNAFERIFGVEADDIIKQAKEKYIEALDKGEPITLEEAFEDNPEAFNTLKQRFYDMGLYIADATQYLKDFKEEKDDSLDATNLYDLSSSMSTAEDAMSSLKSAFDEANESGQITAKTITSLKETFGSIEGISDEWNNYVNVMMSGVASTEEMTTATEKLAEAWLDERMLNGPLDAMERIATIASLTRMGVTNATEYVDDATQEAALNEAAKRLQNPDVNQSEVISEVAKEYGVENSLLQDNIELLKEKAKLENDLAKINEYKSQSGVKELLDQQLEEERNKYTYIGAGEYMDANNKIVSSETVEAWKSTIKRMEDESAELQKWLDENPMEPNADAESLQKDIDEVNNKIKTEITKDIQIKIELQNKSQLVDDIQSIFDTLASAQKEYRENGYLTVDTVQSLINLEPKYLALLYDENGKLNLNKDTLYQVAIARLEDMKLKAQDAILTEAETLATNGTIEALNNQIEVNKATADSYDRLIEQRLDNVKAILEERKAAGELDGFNVDSYISGIKNQINAVSRITTSAQKNIRNTLSSAGNTAKADAKDAFEKLKQKYERQISNYSNQQTYLQNEVDRLQAENKGVSKSYYEEQIAIEEKKLKLYEQERTELLALLAKTKKGTDQWYEIADAVWSVEHAIQGSVKAMVDFRKEIVNLYKEAFDKIGSAYGDLDDLFDDQQNYIDKYNELLELQKKPVTESSIKEQLAIEQKQMQANEAQLISLRKTRDDALANSTMKEGDEEWIAMESSIRDVEAAILDNQIAIENYKQAIIDLYTETFDKLNNMFSNKNDFFTSQQDYIEGYADYLETLGVDVPQEVYDKLIEIEQDKREINVNNLIAARTHLADLEKQGLDATDEAWVNAKNKAVELEKAILDNDKAMAEWQKTINELNFTKFDDFIDRIGNLESEIKNIIGLLYKNKEDIALKNGDWTDEGITTLGLYYQQMEIAKQKAKEYADEIDELTKSYKDGEISEKDYYERLQTLKDGQWDAINNYEDMKDAIIDLNEVRIDMIEEGYQKEIKAYSELIKLKKEELDAERDLYNFKKDIEKQTKDIAELERKIASLSGSTAASDIAERRKLEAQLREANDSLNDSYYNHAKDAQGNALDRENELYEKTRTDNIEELREKLKNVDQVLEETISKVLENANTALDTINGVSSEYGISISGNLIKPWQEAAQNAENWKNEVNGDLGEAGSNLNKFTVIVKNAFTISGKAAESFAESVKTVCNNIETAIGTENEGFTSRLEGYLKYPWENTSAEDGPITTFSNKVETALGDAIDYAEDSYYQMKNNLEAPWEDANLDTFLDNVEGVLRQAIKKSEQARDEISKNLNVSSNTPSYTSGSSNGSKDTTGTSGNNPGTEASEDVKMLQKILKEALGQPSVTIDGKYGPKTMNGVKSMQIMLKQAGLYSGSFDGLYGAKTSAALQSYVNSIIRQASLPVAQRKSWFRGEVYSFFRNRSSYVPSAMYAKGTTSTKRDQWAITDEPQYGDELTLIPGKDGNLSFMRKGTGVVPAKLTEKLMDLAMQNPADMSKNIIQPIISNVATNNYNQLSFDSLVHIDNCTEDSVDQVKKIINDSLNKFAKQMNYRLKHA